MKKSIRTIFEEDLLDTKINMFKSFFNFSVVVFEAENIVCFATVFFQNYWIFQTLLNSIVSSGVML